MRVKFIKGVLAGTERQADPIYLRSLIKYGVAVEIPEIKEEKDKPETKELKNKPETKTRRKRIKKDV